MTPINTAIKFLLVLCSLAPAGVTYAVAAFYDAKPKMGFAILAGVAIATVITVLVIRHISFHGSRHQLRVTEIEPADQENIALIVIYILPLLTVDLVEINTPALISILALVAFITASGYSYHYNPLLNVVGWHFFRVKTREGVVHVVLTQRPLRDARKDLLVTQLTEYIMLETEEV